MTIRDATESDLPQILTIDSESIVPAWSRETFINEIKSDNSRFILAILGYATAGFCILRLIGEDAEILRTAVGKTHRRNGVASRLMMSMLRYSSSNNIRSIFIEVRKSNEAAIALYEKHGFQHMGMRKDYYSHPVEDAITMVFKNTGVSLYVDSGN